MWNGRLVDALNQLAVKASCMRHLSICMTGSATVQESKLRAWALIDFNLREDTA